MAKSVSFDDLKELYDLAFDVLDLEPWTFMSEQEAWVL